MRPTTTPLKPESHLMDSSLICIDCDFVLNGTQASSQAASLHARTHAHRVRLGQDWEHYFDARPESEKSPL